MTTAVFPPENILRESYRVTDGAYIRTVASAGGVLLEIFRESMSVDGEITVDASANTYLQIADLHPLAKMLERSYDVAMAKQERTQR